MHKVDVRRVAPGHFEFESTDSIMQLPLINATHPNLKRFPLLRHANVRTIEVHAGDVLLLPANWYHEVDNLLGASASASPLNVAATYWFGRHSDAPGVNP